MLRPPGLVADDIFAPLSQNRRQERAFESSRRQATSHRGIERNPAYVGLHKTRITAVRKYSNGQAVLLCRGC